MKSKLLGIPLALWMDGNLWDKLSNASPLLIFGLFVDVGMIFYGVYLQRNPRLKVGGIVLIVLGAINLIYELNKILTTQ
jgi:hypothetical protein